MSSTSNDEIVSMNYQQLQEKCKDANVSAGGPASTLRRRLRAVAISSGDEPATKRQKSVTDDLVCPITLELPFDPVTAEDGRIYERAAIEKHIKGKTTAQLKSPMTNEKMGKRFLPAIQQKNLIHTLIEIGVIAGALADTWNTKVKKKKDVEDLLKKAETGDASAMYEVGVYYENGDGGFRTDEKVAFSWYKRAHDAGSIVGTAYMGNGLAIGLGVAKCERQGIMYITMAAAQGSNYAACVLGWALADGKYGLPVNRAEAIKWFQKAVSDDCVFNDLGDEGKEESQQKLQELINTSD